MQKRLIVIVGPTAIGKTALSIKLAKHFKTEVLSSDSRQFFKELAIGTAKPSKTEMDNIPHHFIDSLSIQDYYSVGDFERDFISITDELFKVHDTLIMVGGSGLYVRAALQGLDKFPDIDLKIREGLIKQFEEDGITPLLDQLKKLDPVFYNEVDHANSQRIIRGLETCLSTGKPFSSFRVGNIAKRNFKAIQIGLTADREIIYNRINQRVDLMVKNGLIEEAKRVEKNKELNALQTVGYKELYDYFEGNTDLDTAVELIKRNTRRFAKKQLTWFRKDDSIKWFDYKTDFKEILRSIS